MRCPSLYICFSDFVYSYLHQSLDVTSSFFFYISSNSQFHFSSLSVGRKNSTNESPNEGTNFEKVSAVSEAYSVHWASWCSSWKHGDSFLQPCQYCFEWKAWGLVQMLFQPLGPPQWSLATTENGTYREWYPCQSHWWVRVLSGLAFHYKELEIFLSLFILFLTLLSRQFKIQYTSLQ